MPFNPYDAATDSLDRARGLLSASVATGPRRSLNSEGKRVVRRAQIPAGVRSDMRRLSVVMAVAALDTYLHRLIVERVFLHDALPGALARLDVRFEQLLAQADDTAAAARRQPANSRPRVGVKRQLRDRLLRETFQNYDSVSRALGMAGQSGSWNTIADRMNPPMPTAEIKRRLNAIVMRRNQIVHEGDYERLEKPRGSRRIGLSQREATADIEFVARLIDAIHAVVS